MPDQDSKDQIMLWGPRGSGKTFLLEAFRRRIKLIKRQFSTKNSQPEFELDLNVNRRPSHEEGAVGGTENISIETWLFTRQGCIDDLPHQISTHTHQIQVIDPEGVFYHHNDTTIAPDTEKANIRETVKLLLAENKRFIIILDLGRTGEGTAIRTPSQFVDDLRGLLNLLYEYTDPNNPYQIAGCFTKTDDLGPNIEDLQERALLEMRFGDYSEEIYELTHSQIKNWAQYCFYACSAAGFKEDGKSNMGSNEIIDKTRWQPVNVELPFFWLFEQIEKQRICKSYDYAGGIFKRLFNSSISQRARLSAYITYEEMMRRSSI